MTETPTETTTVTYVVEARDPTSTAPTRDHWFPFVSGARRDFDTPEAARAAAVDTHRWYPLYRYRVVRVTTVREVVPRLSIGGDRP